MQQTAWSALEGDQTKHSEMVGLVACLWERRGFWWGNLKEGYHLGYPDVRWEKNIRMGIKETGWGVEWIHVAQEKENASSINS